MNKYTIGLGLDFTACTVLPTTADGVPLDALNPYHSPPHTWAKLWKMLRRSRY